MLTSQQYIFKLYFFYVGGVFSPSMEASLAQMPVMIALAHSHSPGKANNFAIVFGILYSLF